MGHRLPAAHWAVSIGRHFPIHPPMSSMRCGRMGNAKLRVIQAPLHLQLSWGLKGSLQEFLPLENIYQTTLQHIIVYRVFFLQISLVSFCCQQFLSPHQSIRKVSVAEARGRCLLEFLLGFNNVLKSGCWFSIHGCCKRTTIRSIMTLGVIFFGRNHADQQEQS